MIMMRRRCPTPMMLRLALLLFLLTHNHPGHAADTDQRPPPPKAAPPLPPPERRKQLMARSTGMACSAVAATITLRRMNIRSVTGKVVVVAALTAAYLGGAHTAEVLVDLFPAASITPLQQQQQQQYQGSSSSDPNKQSSSSSFSKQNSFHADIEVDDVEREEIERYHKKKKTILEQMLFWKSDPEPVPEDDTPEVPQWSNAYQKEQNYEEDYGI